MVSSRHLAGAALGLLADRALGEPPAAVHPVAAFGTAMGELEPHLWADRRDLGVVYAAAGLAVGVGAGMAVRSTATAVGTAAAGRMLRTTALAIAAQLEAGDLAGARSALPALVGRDPSGLDEAGVAAAVVESVAENTVDAVVAPACWGAALGAPGALGHRALNTLDAMVGHHTARYERFGWASARGDDVANWMPARVTAGLVVLARPGSRRSILGRYGETRDGTRRPTPGWPRPPSPVPSASSSVAPCGTATGRRPAPRWAGAHGRRRSTCGGPCNCRAPSNGCWSPSSGRGAILARRRR